jgi:hypothetical protein
MRSAFAEPHEIDLHARATRRFGPHDFHVGEELPQFFAQLFKPLPMNNLAMK